MRSKSYSAATQALRCCDRTWNSTISASKWRSNFSESWLSSYTRTCRHAPYSTSQAQPWPATCWPDSPRVCSLCGGTARRTRGACVPLANRYWPSGVSFMRWQAAGNSRSCTSSMRLLHRHEGFQLLTLVSSCTAREAAGTGATRSTTVGSSAGAPPAPELLVLAQALFFLVGQPLRQALSCGYVVHLHGSASCAEHRPGGATRCARTAVCARLDAIWRGDLHTDSIKQAYAAALAYQVCSPAVLQTHTRGILHVTYYALFYPKPPSQAHLLSLLSPVSKQPVSQPCRALPGGHLRFQESCTSARTDASTSRSPRIASER